MLARLPVPSSAALRTLRRLACAGSTIGAIGGVCGIAMLNYDVNRKIRTIQQSLETKRQLQTKKVHDSESQLARMIAAAEAGDFLGLDSIRPPPQLTSSKVNRPVRKLLSQKTEKTVLRTTPAYIRPNPWFPLAREPLSPVAERIIQATMQQHKVGDHNVYGGAQYQSTRAPPKEPPAPHASAPASIRIMHAMMKQLKSRTHTVYGRESKADTHSEPSYNLAEPVGRWLYGSLDIGSKIQKGEAQHVYTTSHKKPSSPQHPRL